MSSDYTIRIEDFGPIEEATVDLRPLTIFIGPSNTGKSYFAGLMYALHRSLDMTPGPLRSRFLSQQRQLRSLGVGELSSEMAQEIEKWASTYLNKEGKGQMPPLPAPIVEHVNGVLKDFQGLGDALVTQVARCFGVDDPKVLSRHSSRSSAALLDLRISESYGACTRFRASLTNNGGDYSTEVDCSGLSFDADLVRRLVENLSHPFIEEYDTTWEGEFRSRDFLRELTRHVFRRSFGPLVRRSAYYLPADRTGVMHSHHVVVSALVQRASLAGIRRFDDVPMLSGVMADFLDLLVSRISQLEQRKTRSAKVKNLATQMERHILEGSVRVNQGEVQYPSFAYRPMGWKKDVPLMRSSSMVSELAPIVLYLRHIVEQGDVLIIEEPESHLHPSKQAAFARELAKVVNAGVHVVITTHSEWFLEQIGNLVRASELPPVKQGEFEQVLSPSDVGAWLFESREKPRGSVVKEVSLDPETGLYPTDYGAVSDALYNESATIYNELHKGVQ